MRPCGVSPGSWPCRSSPRWRCRSGSAAPPRPPTKASSRSSTARRSTAGTAIPSSGASRTARSPARRPTEKPTKGNTFLIWRGGKPDDFELKFECKLRERQLGHPDPQLGRPENKWVVGGYQADMDGEQQLHRHPLRRGLPRHPRQARREDRHRRRPQAEGRRASSATATSWPKSIKKGDWNEYHIIAKGNHIIQKINGQLMCERDRRGQGRRKRRHPRPADPRRPADEGAVPQHPPQGDPKARPAR